MKIKIFIIFFLIIFIPNIFSNTMGEGKEKNKKIKIRLNKKQKLALIKFVFEPKSFLEMKDKSLAPETLNNFFTNDIYKNLRGTIFIGFNYDEGFKDKDLKEIIKEVDIVLLKGTLSTNKYIEAFQEAIFEVLKKGKIKITKKANFKVGICIVGVQPITTKKTHAGLIVEFYIENKKTGKSVFRRIYNGKKKGLHLAIFDSVITIFETLKI